MRPTRSHFIALAALVLLLSACGDRFVAPAAVVGGSRISSQTLQHELDLVLLDPQLKQQVTGSGGEKSRKDLTRQLLAYLIQLGVAESYAGANGISVSPSDVDEAVQETITSLGGEAQFQQELKARGLTLDRVRRNIERQILFNKVQDAVAAQAGVPSGATPEVKGIAFQRWLTQRLGSADVRVNPRFGRLDPKTGQIVPISSTAT